MTTDPYSFENLRRQYLACRRNKRNTANQLRFELDAEANLLDLQRELRDHTYRPGRSICFVTQAAKPREVFAADFRDRVVHHVLVSRLEAVFEPCFIHDSYACRKGKGVLGASDRFMEFLRRSTASGRRPAWALKLDIASFFPSIHKETLYDIIARRVRDPELLWLTRIILFHDPTVDYRFKPGRARVPRPESKGYPIPAQKSLFGNENERGLPIGNLTSQFWANVYLNELDHFAKRELKCRCYLRYVDDLMLLHHDPEVLRQWRQQVAAFARDRLKLALRDPAAEPEPVERGVDFVGWKTWWNYRLPRRQTLASCTRRLRDFERSTLRLAWGGVAQRVDFGREGSPVDRLQSVVASYSGHLRHGASFRQWRDLLSGHRWIEDLFEPDGTDAWRFHARWTGAAIVSPRFSRQYARLIRHAGDRALVFCQVGRFVEFYGPQREPAARVLRLVRVKIGRGGYAFSVGFPTSLRGEYLSRAVRAGYAVADVRETTRIDPRCAVRAVIAVWLPAERPASVVAETGK